ncbi:hypothetical protein AMTR_s00064p00088040 [Amborella trichopoda]|uniref:Uncharacterized protein n=1 Tax=Amborella trichopoda TaxID=13333 RepID=U5DH52_AMBTC|nr:hypothetical protein AMTR_s00064p00088040 [Amborella trichopoda]
MSRENEHAIREEIEVAESIREWNQTESESDESFLWHTMPISKRMRRPNQHSTRLIHTHCTGTQGHPHAHRRMYERCMGRAVVWQTTLCKYF